MKTRLTMLGPACAPAVLTAAIAGIVLLTAGSTLAATVPSSWDFGTDPGKDDLSDFTLTNDSALSTWELTGDAARINHFGGFGSDLALTEFTDLGGTSNKDFQVESVLTVANNSDTNFNRFGIAALVDAGTDNTGIAGMIILRDDGTLQLTVREGVNGTQLATGTWNGVSRANLEGETLTFSMTGSYVGDDLLIDFSVTDASNTTSTVSTLVLDPATYDGSRFGFGGRLSAFSNDPMRVEFDTFSVIPEPGSLALMGLGGLCLLCRCGRKA